jgi:hypothetical protein
VVGRVDISYAVILLARCSSAPDRCHYLVVKRLCKDLRRTIDWEILNWRQAPCDLLPSGYIKTLSIDNMDLSEFPNLSNLLKLVGYVDGRMPPTCALVDRTSFHRCSSALEQNLQSTGLCLLLSLRFRTHTLSPICSKRFIRFGETSWMVLAFINLSITSLVKLHLTNRTLVLSPIASSKTSLLGYLAFLERETARRSPEVENL